MTKTETWKKTGGFKLRLLSLGLLAMLSAFVVAGCGGGEEDAGGAGGNNAAGAPADAE